VIDAGYRGEIQVLMTNLGEATVELKAGEKIAQMIPVPVLTGLVEEDGNTGRVGARGEGIWELGTVRQLPANSIQFPAKRGAGSRDHASTQGSH
jgi:hypothetical protein